MLLFAALIVAQVLAVPGTLAHAAEESPELAYLRWPMLTVAVLGLLCVQVGIVCTWRLHAAIPDNTLARPLVTKRSAASALLPHLTCTTTTTTNLLGR